MIKKHSWLTGTHALMACSPALSNRVSDMCPMQNTRSSATGISHHLLLSSRDRRMEVRFSEDPTPLQSLCVSKPCRKCFGIKFSLILVGLLTLTLFSRRILVFAELPVAPDSEIAEAKLLVSAHQFVQWEAPDGHCWTDNFDVCIVGLLSCREG